MVSNLIQAIVKRFLLNLTNCFTRTLKHHLFFFFFYFEINKSNQRNRIFVHNFCHLFNFCFYKKVFILKKMHSKFTEWTNDIANSSKIIQNQWVNGWKGKNARKTGTQRTATQTVAFNVHMSTVFSYRPDKSGSRFVRSTLYTHI